MKTRPGHAAKNMKRVCSHPSVCLVRGFRLLYVSVPVNTARASLHVSPQTPVLFYSVPRSSACVLSSRFVTRPSLLSRGFFSPPLCPVHSLFVLLHAPALLRSIRRPLLHVTRSVGTSRIQKTRLVSMQKKDTTGANRPPPQGTEFLPVFASLFSFLTNSNTLTTTVYGYIFMCARA